MLWNRYVFRRGDDVHELWDEFFARRPLRLLYITGSGFDPRAEAVLESLLSSLKTSGHVVSHAKMLLLELDGYKLDQHLQELTKSFSYSLEQLFREVGTTTRVPFGLKSDVGTPASTTLRANTKAVLEEIADYTDVVLDVSSLPRTMYLSLLTAILQKLMGPGKSLQAGGVNFQVLAGEDATLDGAIVPTEPSNDLVIIPGFSAALHAESVQDWPMVWFPILGEHRESQLRKILQSAIIPNDAEICPILPHPSTDPRRADRLLLEYREALFDSTRTPMSNILYVHESNPFEAYRQLLTTMKRYRNSMAILGGCRLVVTPLGSKLVTLGAGMACFEMQPPGLSEGFSVAIPHAEPTRYEASEVALEAATPIISSMVLTGQAYS